MSISWQHFKRYEQTEEQNISVLCTADTENCLFLLLKLPFIYLKAAIVLPLRFLLAEVQLFRGMSEECQTKPILSPSAISNKYTFLKPDNYCCISLCCIPSTKWSGLAVSHPSSDVQLSTDSFKETWRIAKCFVDDNMDYKLQ